MVSFVGLDPSEYRDLVRRALDEHIGQGDITTQAVVAEDQRARVYWRRRRIERRVDPFGARRRHQL